MMPWLHVVTDDRVLARADFPADARQVLEAGGARVALHVRGPRTSGRAVYRAAADLIRPAHRSGAWLVVNDRVDVALVLGITRVHLGGRSMPVAVARRLLGPDARVGRSVHSAAEADGGHGRIDYLFAGTVFATPSHAGTAPGGIDVVRDVVGASPAPVLGIGGITAGRTARVLSAGARGVAVMRAVWDAPSPGDGVRRFLDSWPEGRTAGMDDKVTIRLNGKTREVAADITVSGLLDELGLIPGMVVVERNREILARESYAAVRLSEGDELELVHFVGGG